jgi:hypothetical protein
VRPPDPALLSLSRAFGTPWPDSGKGWLVELSGGGVMPVDSCRAASTTDAGLVGGGWSYDLTTSSVRYWWFFFCRGEVWPFL